MVDEQELYHWMPFQTLVMRSISHDASVVTLNLGCRLVEILVSKD